ncbi:MAG: hypothetical protein M3413_12315 [Bacteroidota bacterium]|jgi:hypothetical protein|nr:hypothetical protein [Bacteroidota bacterium]
MFIKKLWNYNKYVAFTFCIIIGIWLFLNIKQGAVATPLLQYGMYSGPYFKKDTQSVFKIIADGEQIDFSTLTIAERDLIQTSLEMYLAEEETNKTSFFTIKRILTKVYLGKLMKEENYLNQITHEDFKIWFRNLLENILSKKISTIQVYAQKFVWENNVFTPASSPDKINELGF